MKTTLLLLISCICTTAFSQEKSPFVKFGKVSTEDLQRKIYSIDSGANAVVLSDIGNTEVEGNAKGWFSLKTNKHTVIHILNKNGYDESSVEIPLTVTKGAEERLTSFKAVTYNLENGKVVETKLGKSDLIKDQKTTNNVIMKFTMPQVKEGSIIEYEYTIVSDFLGIPDPWYFQSLTAPTLWSEYNFSVPEFFSYNFLSRGYQPLAIVENKKRDQNFRIREERGAGAAEQVDFKANVTSNRWVVKNAPELKEEGYTKSLRNHIARMELQLNAQQYPLTYRSYRSTWQEITNGMLESEYFGLKLNSNNNWLKEELSPIIKSESDPLEKAKKIFEYVRDEFKTTGEYAVYMNDNLKSVFKAKKGNVAELNLLLTAMLRYADLTAEPVMLSTTNHGYSFEYLPMINSMNYIVVKFTEGGKDYYLDASHTRMGFGKLPQYCYNGFACVVNKDATPVYLNSDNLKENRRVLFQVSNDGKHFDAKVTKIESYYESLDIRDDISDKGEEDYIKELQKKYGETYALRNFRINSLKNFNDPVQITYNLKMNEENSDVMYINPYFGEAFKKNPFSSSNRAYPVEMPYAQNETIISSISIPEGYTVDELPKQMRVNYDESGKSYFEYRVSNSGGVISFMSKLNFDKTFFMPEEYNMLRDFFNLVVKKQSEPIVLKKKS